MKARGAVLVTVTNRARLARRFGPAFALAVDTELLERARRVCTGGARVQADGEGSLTIVWPDAATVDGRPASDIPLAELLVRLTGRRAPFAQVARMAALRGHWIDAKTVAAFDACCAMPGSPQQTSADFEVAEAVLHAIRNDAFTLRMNPIYNPETKGQVLYYGCEVLCRELQACASLPQVYLRSMARLGLMRYVDDYVLTRVMNLLEHSPQLSLGLNLSGESLTVVAHWQKALARLGESPDVARRLVVEVDECAGIGRGGHALLDCLQQLGCRIAINQYGIAFGAGMHTVVAQPDIVKIASLFIEAARESEEAADLLRKLVQLGSNMARDVVLLGAKTGADCQIARDVDAKWVQQ